MKIEFSPILRFFVISACIAVILLAIKAAGTVVNTLMLALIITICAVPLAEWLLHRGRPAWQALLITVVAVLFVVLGTAVFFIFSMAQLAHAIPQYAANFQERSTPVVDWLTTSGVESLTEIINPVSFLGSMMSFIMGAASNVVAIGFMLVIVVFMLVEAFHLPGKAKELLSPDSTFLINFRTYTQDVRKYVYITAQAGFLAGTLDAIFLLIIGVDFAILWGVLAAILSFIPSIGFIFSLIPPMILAYVQFGWEAALIVLLGFWLINGTVDNIVKPRFIGEGLDLSVLVVFLSLFIWGWALGPIGGLLSVPITMMFKTMVLDSREETRWLADMMKTGSKPADKTLIDP